MPKDTLSWNDKRVKKAVNLPKWTKEEKLKTGRVTWEG